MDLATSRRDDRAQEETELTVVDESGLSSQRATESFGNEQRRMKPDSGCFCELKGDVQDLAAREHAGILGDEGERGARLFLFFSVEITPP
jgi:hypothetical protein